ncbi:xylan 1,4-beta-xylosidase [Sphaerisporangium sp. TRM90804]|uniref:GH39 family glycosyl hydrolase n=1 Tax=Sphaerisporangium sp. TRM90804 TaxID=3031113 RepID=UPI00244B9630|nr:xylan 1,4-beta-xylosidase [Sphaerisporangium sp. TRM90804]MDH2429066.1 xylan 1,4-beta-xylosidase [Sphaerisporangium sp. TRM90804]
MLENSGRHARRRYIPRWPVALGAGLVALLTVVGLLTYAAQRGDREDGVAATIPATPEPPPTLEQPPVTADWPRWGVTHTQYSADNEDTAAAGRAKELFSRVPMLQNQHIMGWGAGNPEPSPGKYDFRDLDRRVKLMAATKAQPVLTLCCAPDWMKGGAEGRTAWSKIEVAPRREHFDDFAALAVTVAKRYPTVTHYMVWNEFKGFWDDAHNAWNAEAYTDLYNRVYDALKAVNPKIQVGGPYIPIDSHVSTSDGSALKGPWGVIDRRSLEGVEYWLKHKKGADFVVIDGSSATNDQGVVPDEFTALGKFSAVTSWLRQKSGALPIWWAEWYVAPDSVDWNETRRTAVQAAAMIEFARGGVATALYWNPQTRRGGECPGCMWSAGSGDEMPMAGLLSGFTRWFPAEARLIQVEVSDPRVRVLAVENQMIMVNTAGTDVTVTVDGKPFDLTPYAVTWSDRGR